MNYSTLKVAELKQLVNKRGISPTGLSKKQHFVDALEADDGEADEASGDADDADDAQVKGSAATEEPIDYSKLRVAELKDLLNQRGISLTGLKKQELINALEDDDNDAADNSQTQAAQIKKVTTKKRAAASPTPANAAPTKKAKKGSAETDTKADIKTEAKVADAQYATPDNSSKLHVPVDEHCPLALSGRVYIAPENGIIYDASLNQTNASNNNNKFYRVQILQTSNGQYKTWTRWGRVGESGQNALLGNGSLQDALTNFEKKFKDKSGLMWSQRGENPKPKKYVFVERSYLPDDEDEAKEPKSKDASKDGAPRDHAPPKSTLAPSVQSLMELIFNQQYFAAAMQSLNYDAAKLPLGKLSKATITRGFQALKDLSEQLCTYSTGVEDLSNLYYSLIPHDFGRNRPPVINSQQQLKREIELLESLSDLKDAHNIIKAEKDGDEEIHPLDARFKGLSMQEMTPLPHEDTEFTEISQYLLKTEAHGIKYAVEDIFRIERQGEHARFEKSPYANIPGDRRLLWHGSRATNFGGILSQGLRIAPPEAPVNGYMFDKGIYLADMSSKSANYCCPYDSGGYALLLLCEAELGTPMQTLKNSKYDAGSEAKKLGVHSTWGQGRIGPKGWKDAKCVHESLAGVKMPDTTESPGPTGIDGVSLQYNEFICYDVAQVRLRYLLRVRT